MILVKRPRAGHVILHSQMNSRFQLRASRARKLFAAVAVTALALLLVRPVCDAYAAQAAPGYAQDVSSVHHRSTAFPAGQGEDADGSCCARIADGALRVPFDLGPPVASGAEQPTAAGASAFPFFESRRAPYRVFARGALPPPRSYYAHSARILR